MAQKINVLGIDIAKLLLHIVGTDDTGHVVLLIAPPCVKASMKSPKHKARDAEAIREAVTRPTMRFVPIKQLAQQDIQPFHGVRARLIKTRTAWRPGGASSHANTPRVENPVCWV
jgi:transposase